MSMMNPGTVALPLLRVDVLWRRLVAFIIDGLLLSIIQALLSGVFGVERVTSGSPFPLPGVGFTSFATSWTLDPFWWIVVAVAYFLVQESLFGATLGKRAMRLRVVDLSGRPMTVRQAMLRNTIRVLDGLPSAYSLGALVALFSPRHQRIGDMVAGTLVVDADSAPLSARSTDEVRRGARAVLVILVAASLFCLGYSYYGRPPLVIESWRNTGQYFFQKPVASYTLGTPQWNLGMVSYPFTLRPATGLGVCHGLMTLQWGGPIGGWTLRNGSSYCTAPGQPTTFYGYGGS